MDQHVSDFKYATVYSRPGCAACTNIKDVLKQNGYSVVEREVSQHRDKFYTDFPGAKTVPQVTINGVCIGGVYDVLAYLKNSTW